MTTRTAQQTITALEERIETARMYYEKAKSDMVSTIIKGYMVSSFQYERLIQDEQAVSVWETIGGVLLDSTDAEEKVRIVRRYTMHRMTSGHGSQSTSPVTNVQARATEDAWLEAFSIIENI